MRQMARSKYVRAAAGLIILCLGAAVAYGDWPIVPAGTPAAPIALQTARPLLRAGEIETFVATEARGIDAVVVLDTDGTRLSLGDADRPMNTASVRKSILSLLVGIAEDRGLLNLEATLAELDINETVTPLTATERDASLRDLVMARSGIYLPSGGETAHMRQTRPARGSVAPGEQFYYNNWDFNVLGIAFERATGVPIGVALNEWLAIPLGLQDFVPAHVYFDRWGSASDYPTYRMFLSARDLARIGQMVAQDGEWQGQQVVPEAWIDRALYPWSEVGPPLSAPPYDGYGYSWWINTETGAAVASGWGGQYMHVDRTLRRVVVTRRDTGQSLLGHIWFRAFATRGQVQDLLAVLDMVDAG